MNRLPDERSILLDPNFWKGAAMFTAGCLVMGVATNFATSTWFSRNEQPNTDPIVQGELGADQALALWANFPVAAEPRPLVIVGPDYRPPSFESDKKVVAFGLGRWSVPKRMTLPHRTADGYAIRYVGAALEELRASLEQSAGEEELTTGLEPGTAEERAARPVIIDAKLDHASFATDRGVRSLPAWVVSFAGQSRPLILVAVASPSRYDPRTSRHAESTVRVSSDGRQLTYAFTGAAPGRGPCEAEYAPVVEESPTAVAIGARTYLAKGDPAACGPLTHRRTVSIQLDQPLGDRVAVTALYGAPMAPVRERGTASS